MLTGLGAKKTDVTIHKPKQPKADEESESDEDNFSELKVRQDTTHQRP